ncbi:DNA-binding response regulator [Carbonactinospora thermoautotrophica]|uniref:Two-component system response regulator n=1 Tax=Carbonactinospora thermoautotrophica TaxID=1469144 RepID=A0A132MZQ9_9ACTN|nr:response regulator transcription factor [Carbonactinospora thermoautotrophica]KWX02822.1 Two-component system response regulator [Carbonactinospora thermoautotrophica]MCX9192747.1 DNA-binding response regulator [Carbonactinospora thermoautotrophica]
MKPTGRGVASSGTGNVLLVDDHPVVLAGLAQLLARGPRLRVVGEATSAQQAIEYVRRGGVDLVLLDLRLGEQLAPDVCRDLRRADPRVKVVVFTAFDDRALLRASLAAGASGLLLKDTRGLDLVDALHRVLAGQVVVDPRLRADEGGRPAGPADTEPYEPLTDREYEVLRLMAQGLTSREIADRLELAVNTVRSYAQDILTKLRARNRVQALAIARQLRLL